MPETISSEVLIKQLNWRYATKKFDASKKISEQDWDTLAEALRLSPSSYGLQPWKFIVVQNEELRQKLKQASWNQSQVTDCSHYVVFTYRRQIDASYIDHFLNAVSQVQGTPIENLKNYRNVILGDVVSGPRSQIIEPWVQRQTYIAMGFLLETAALLGIDACPMEGLDPSAYDHILGLKDGNYGTVASVALGYRSASDSMSSLKKVRYCLDEILEIR